MPPKLPGRPAPPANEKAVRRAIEEREELLKWMDVAKERERELRTFISAQLFPKPKEGNNSFITAGMEIKLVHKLTRTIDADIYREQRSSLVTAGIPLDKLVRDKPELIISAYRELAPNHLRIFNRVLTVKEAAPQLTVVT